MKNQKKSASKITKSLLSLLLVFILIINLSTIISQETPPLQDIPIVGNVNAETGQIKSFEKFQEVGETLSQKEQNKSYLLREWTALAYKNSFIGPILFYTEKFFSFFNPLWKIAFGVEFSWSWAFILSFLIWTTLVIIFYFPSKAFTEFNAFLTLIFAMIIATLAGSGGVIRIAVDILTKAIVNLWWLTLALIIILGFIAIYSYLFDKLGKDLKKESEEEKQERAKKNIQALGEVAGKGLEEFSG